MSHVQVMSRGRVIGKWALGCKCRSCKRVNSHCWKLVKAQWANGPFYRAVGHRES